MSVMPISEMLELLKRKLATDVTQRRLDEMACRGIVTSICYGPAANKGIWFSVNVTTKDGQTFPEPFAVLSYEQCVLAARLECERRGWI